MNVSPNRNTRSYPREWSRVRRWSDRAFLNSELSDSRVQTSMIQGVATP